MKPTFLGLIVRRHPWLAGQLWAALVVCETRQVVASLDLIVRPDGW